MVEARGFEPLTSGLQSPRSAKLSYAPSDKHYEGWLRGRDLNPRPLGYEPNELPDCSTPRQSYYHKTREIRNLKFAFRNLKSAFRMVGLGRVELPTSRLSGVRSNQLSYRPLVLFRGILTRNAPILTQKRATLLFLVVRISVDAPEGRVASVAKYCLRSTLLPNCKRSTSVSNFRYE